MFWSLLKLKDITKENECRSRYSFSLSFLRGVLFSHFLAVRLSAITASISGETFLKKMWHHPPYSKPKGQVNSLDICNSQCHFIFFSFLLAYPDWCSNHIQTCCLLIWILQSELFSTFTYLNYFTWPHNGTYRLGLTAWIISVPHSFQRLLCFASFHKADQQVLLGSIFPLAV